MSGNTNPKNQVIKKAATKFRENASLRARIDKQETQYETQGGEQHSVWMPELNRIRAVVVKNARGHFYHELGEPLMSVPDEVFIAPISSMDASSLEKFANDQPLVSWGEVGSRWNRRVLTESIFDELGFAVVQPNVYKFKVHTNEARVDTVIRDYLFTSVSWS